MTQYYNPTVNKPFVVITINNSAATISTAPITLQDMTLNGTRYDNPTWSGYTPLLQTSSGVILKPGTDFDVLPTGGFVLSPNGNFPAVTDQSQIIYPLNFYLFGQNIIPAYIQPNDAIVNTSNVALTKAVLNATYGSLPAGTIVNQISQDGTIDTNFTKLTNSNTGDWLFNSLNIVA